MILEAGRRILRAAPLGSRLTLFGSHVRGEAGGIELPSTLDDVEDVTPFAAAEVDRRFGR